MSVNLSSVLMMQIVDWANSSPEKEVCGLLFGKDAHISDWSEARNVAQDPSHRFEIDPAALIAAHKKARTGGPAIMGYVHSHPSGSATPSACDADMAQGDGMLWLIVAPPDYAVWRAGTSGLHGRFERVNLILTDG
jgi:proteasome lid subunit RPN8/RPN11